MQTYTILFTGLSGAGKTTLANMFIEMELKKNPNKKIKLIDGDVMRKTLCSDLGMSVDDRNENVRRMSWVAHELNTCGINVVIAAMAPFAKCKEEMRRIITSNAGTIFREIYVETSINNCKKRDIKNIYKKFDNGEISNVIGLDVPYEITKYDLKINNDIVYSNIQNELSKITY